MLEKGDRVRIDIPDETDPDHDKYHGKHGTITEIFEDDKSNLYTVKIEEDHTMDFREHDLRPPIK